MHSFIPATDMTGEQLIAQFEQGTLEPFHHADHVRVAFAYLCRYSVLEALAKFSAGLKNFATLHGQPQLYHQTITWAYMLLIHERMAIGRMPGKWIWEEFAAQNADLLAWKHGILKRYYSEETLRSDLARSVFVMPDKAL